MTGRCNSLTDDARFPTQGIVGNKNSNFSLKLLPK